MSQQNLNDILNECINRLADGETVEDCLRRYPDYADELRPLLQIGRAATRATIPVEERAAMRLRLDAQMDKLLEDTNFNRKPLFYLPSASLVLVASLIVVVIGIFLVLPRDTDSVGGEETSTPVATSSPEVTVEPTPTTGTPDQTSEPTATDVTPSQTSDPTVIVSTLAVTATPTVITPEITETRASDTTSTQLAEPCTMPDGWVEYRLQSGDTLSALAIASDTTVETLQEVNCIDDARFIVVGQTVFLPRQPDAIQRVPPSTNQGTGTGNSGTPDDDWDDDWDDEEDWYDDEEE